MNTVRDIMATNVIWLSTTNKVKTAILLMKGHNVGGLPVLDGDRVVGVLDRQALLGKDSDIPVEHVMDKEFVAVAPDMAVAHAADLMAKTGSGRLLVMDGGRLVGIVTRSDLLPELGKSLDPLTKLPRADAMRDWGITALKRGDEITVIFVDLDEFGQFNKKYGHITGDRVLKHVAGILEANVEDKRDMLCRYAGDEFVIVTTRKGDEARELAKRLDREIRETIDPELPEPVTGSTGVHGGKRTKEREDVHFEATLDNLINLASKSCTVAKGQKTGVFALNDGVAAATVELPTESPPQAQPAPPARVETEHARLKVQGLNFSWDGGSLATVEVELAKGDTTNKHLCSGFALGRSALRLVADAVAGAVCKFLPSGCGVAVDNVSTISAGTDEEIVVVTAVVVTPQTEVRLVGSSIVKQDRYRAAAAAFLDAVNRQLSTLLR